MERKVEDRKKVLLVDDSEIDRSILAFILEEEFDITEASGGREALSILEEDIEEYSLILLDVMMPEFNGFDTLDAIVKKGWLDIVPVMMISASDAVELVKRAYEMGAMDYINRNMDGIVIRKRISNVLKLFEAQRESLRRAEAEKATLLEEKYVLKNKDELTGCWNFSSFKRSAAKLIQNNPNKKYSLWYVDIRQFKFINETFGFDEGDRLLKYWVDILSEVLDNKEIVGRISADIFVVLTSLCDEWEFAERFKMTTDKLRTFFNKPGVNYDVEIVAGVYLVEDMGTRKLSVNQMVDFANVAQEEAKKRNGTCYCIYSDELWNKQVRASKIRKHLNSALANGEVSVWMQPQYDYVSGKMVGAEALCRWNHKNLGNISPGEFIPILEKSSQVTILDRFVWEEVCKHLKRWREEKRISVALSVNISRIDIQEEDFYDHVKSLVEKYEIEPKSLRFEITESAYMDNSDQVIHIVEQLQNDGFIVEMDDFGSGYSSLNMLKDVPVDILKLDLRFLSDMIRNSARGGNILSAVIRMAHGMNLPVIAEGVETMEQADYLKNLGCKIMQGYYFSRPLPIDQFEALLERQQTGELPTSVYGEGLRDLSEILDAKSTSGFVFDRCIGPAMLLEYDGQHVAVIMMNDGIYDITSKSREEFERIRSDLFQYMEEPYLSNMKDALEEAVNCGISHGRGGPYGDGGWAQTTYRLVSSGAYSHIIFAIVDDRTRVHKMESEINELNRELRSFMDCMPGGMFRFEFDELEKGKQFTHVGENLLSLLQYENRESFEMKFHNNFEEMIYEADRERVIREIKEQFETKEYCYCLHRVERGDGEVGWYYGCGRKVKDIESGKVWIYAMLIKLDKEKQKMFGVHQAYN